MQQSSDKNVLSEQKEFAPRSAAAERFYCCFCARAGHGRRLGAADAGSVREGAGRFGCRLNSCDEEFGGAFGVEGVSRATGSDRGRPSRRMQWKSSKNPRILEKCRNPATSADKVSLAKEGGWNRFRG